MDIDDPDPHELFISKEREGVRIPPWKRDGEIVIEYIEDHFVQSAIFECKSYYDHIRYGALKWLCRQHENLKQENSELREKVARLEQATYGVSSEQIPRDNVEAPAPNAPEARPDTKKIIPLPKEKRPSGGGRKPLPAHLTREDVIHELPAHDRVCPCCRGALHPIGQEVTEQLKVIPVQFKVVRHVRTKYVCRRCEAFVIAPGAKPLIEKSSYASPDFLAYVACSKYQFGLPFYRQEAIFDQAGSHSIGLPSRTS